MFAPLDEFLKKSDHRAGVAIFSPRKMNFASIIELIPPTIAIVLLRPMAIVGANRLNPEGYALLERTTCAGNTLGGELIDIEYMAVRTKFPIMAGSTETTTIILVRSLFITILITLGNEYGTH